MDQYKKYDRKAAAIVTKLRDKVAKSGYYENLGQDELRKFNETINKTDMSYAEKAQLSSMLAEAINSI